MVPRPRAGHDHWGYQVERRVFISYASADRAWAEWVAWQLTDAGYATFLDVDDLSHGDALTSRLDGELRIADAVVALLSADRAPAGTELGAILSSDSVVIPVLVDDARLPPAFATLQAVSLTGLGAEEARKALLRAVRDPSPGDSPASDLIERGRLRQLGLAGPRLPGDTPRVWNLPPRNPRFTGRDDMLARLRQALTSNSPVVVRATGGMGKTQLAIEYAYRFAGEYELVWWIRAGRPGLITEQLAALAVRTGAVSADTPLAEAGEALKAELRTRSRWLLIFDDAAAPDALVPHLPEGAGHVLVTSYGPDRQNFATEFAVDTFTRAESIKLLRTKVPSLTTAEGDELASLLGDLPLALAQAAAVLGAGGAGDPGIDVREYVRLLAETHTRLDTGEEQLRSYSRSLGATIRLAVEHLREEGEEAATAFLFGCALLAPAAFPLHALPRSADRMPEPLADVLRSRAATARMLRQLSKHGLVRVHDGSLRLHTLTKSVLRDLLSDDERVTAARAADALLVTAMPQAEDEDDEAARERWTALMPHLLAIEPRDLATNLGRLTVCLACALLTDRGDPVTARDRLQQLHQAWVAELGVDHRQTLLAATYLAEALRRTGAEDRSLPLLEEVLRHQRRVRGEDDPETLAAASRLAVQLADAGRLPEARRLGEDTLGRRRRVLGEDHPLTLDTRANLALDLRALGDVQAARRLSEEVLVRRRRVLGEDHPDTLAAAAQLARLLGDLQLWGPALELAESTLARSRQVLGEDHPRSLDAVTDLARLLASSGHETAASRLAEDTLTRLQQLHGEHHPITERAARDLSSDSLRRHRALQPARGTGGDTSRKSPQPGEGSSTAHVVPPMNPARPVADQTRVWISYAPSDEGWAQWVAAALIEWDHQVTLQPVRPHEDDPRLLLDLALKSADVVVTLFSQAYFQESGSWTQSEWARLTLLDSVEQRRFVPVFVESVDLTLLPTALRTLVTPPLQELDEEAAQALLRYVMRRPGRPVPERDFPGTRTEPVIMSDSVLTRQLVNALERSAVISSRDGLDAWTGMMEPAVRARIPVRRDMPLRVQLINIVRTCMDFPGGLATLADALELLDPDSAEVREVRRIVDRIESRQEAP